MIQVLCESLKVPSFSDGKAMCFHACGELCPTRTSRFERLHLAVVECQGCKWIMPRLYAEISWIVPLHRTCHGIGCVVVQFLFHFWLGVCSGIAMQAKSEGFVLSPTVRSYSYIGNLLVVSGYSVLCM